MIFRCWLLGSRNLYIKLPFVLSAYNPHFLTSVATPKAAAEHLEVAPAKQPLKEEVVPTTTAPLVETTEYFDHEADAEMNEKLNAWLDLLG